MVRTACTEPQCLYKGALFPLPFKGTFEVGIIYFGYKTLVLIYCKSARDTVLGIKYDGVLGQLQY